MSILGRDIPSQRKNRTLLKRTVQMLMLSFLLPNYMQYVCKAWFYRKKIDHNIFRSIFGTGYFIGISLHVGAFKKMQQNCSIELTFISREIGIFGGIQPRMITTLHIYPIFKI